MNIKVFEKTVHSQMNALMSDFENGGLSLKDFYDRTKAILHAVRSAEARCTNREYLDTLFDLQKHVLDCRGNASCLFAKEVGHHEGA